MFSVDVGRDVGSWAQAMPVVAMDDNSAIRTEWSRIRLDCRFAFTVGPIPVTFHFTCSMPGGFHALSNRGFAGRVEAEDEFELPVRARGILACAEADAAVDDTNCHDEMERRTVVQSEAQLICVLPPAFSVTLPSQDTSILG